jgi:serine protease Do
MTVLHDLQEAIEGAVARVGPAVVGLGRGWQGGSGVVVAEGVVLTNAHNLKGEDVPVVFADGRRAVAKAGGAEQSLDVAALAVDTTGIEPVEWAPEKSASTGTPVIALATPGGRGLRATLGFVSATDRSFRGPRGRRIRGCLEHTAPLPRGSSGGPLVDEQGRLLGLNAVRLEGGLIMAVPTPPSLRERLGALAAGESASPARLGVAVAPPYVARRLRRAVGLPERDGVLVRGVEDGGAAADAGLERGDLIVAAGGRPIDGIDTLHDALETARDAGRLELTLLRGTEERAATVSFERQEVTP